MRISHALLASAMIVSLGAAVASATAMTYTIDPAQSILTLSGNAIGQAFTPQFAGSDAISYTGTINADRGASTVQFLSGSTIDASLQTGFPEPDIDSHVSSPDPTPANYGVQAPLGPVFGPDDTTTGYFAIYNLVLGATSASIPISGTSFSSTGVTGLFSAGQYAYVKFGDLYEDIYASGTPSLIGASATNAGASGSLVTVGSVETLTLPVSLTYPFTNPDGIDGSFILSGNLVATRAVPEPAMMATIAIFLPALFRRRPKI